MGSPREGGRLVFESAFSSLDPQPDMLYPYAFPRSYFERYAPKAKEAWRMTNYRRFAYAAYLQRLTFGVLHASVGPECTDKFQENFWRWSSDATGVSAHWPGAEEQSPSSS